MLVVVALAAPGASSATSPDKKKSIPAAAAFVLPPSKDCLAKRKLTLRLRKIRTVRWTGATVRVNGKRFKRVKRSDVGRRIKLTGLPQGTIRLSITARARDGRRATAKRTYTTCSPDPAPPQPSPPAPPGPQPVSGAAGSYSGFAGGRALTFYVSGDGKHLQDIAATTFLGCVGSPGSGFGETLIIGDIAIAPDGSFTATTTQTGIFAGAPATFTYTFAGHVHGTTAAGVPRLAGRLLEDIAYDNGTVHSCSTNLQAWSVTRDTQGLQTGTVPPAGSYFGFAGGRALAFSVAGTHVQTITATTFIGCVGSPGSGFGHQLTIDDIPITADGSFTATTTQTGIVFGAPATFTYTFAGHVHGTTLAGVARLAGSLRADITYDNGTIHTCSSNNQAWSATRS